MTKYTGDGPVVMLSNSDSIFSTQLAAYWRSRGLDVVVVTETGGTESSLPGGISVVRSNSHITKWTHGINRKFLNPVLNKLESTVPRFKRRFTRKTGLSAEHELWWPELRGVNSAWTASRVAISLRPKFVFGQEVATYGLSTALCRGVPRILFPWGADVMTYPEVSPFHFALTKLSLRAVDLIVPTSTTAARHIRERFGVPPERVHAVSWGVERQKFKRATVETRRIVCAKWGIDPNATIFLNPRRFRPAWGGFVSLEAFMRLAAEQPLSHFILFGGLGNEEFTREAKAKLEEAGLLSTFTLLEGDTPLEVCAELMSISDVFVSLLGRGDMRSSSVLQAAASGGIPVVSDSEEAREMERNGFAGFFVRPDQVEDVLTTLKSCARNPERLAQMRARNDVFLAANEDYARQMDKLLELIESVCADYRTK